jgi:hypothetical protein
MIPTFHTHKKAKALVCDVERMSFLQNDIYPLPCLPCSRKYSRLLEAGLLCFYVGLLNLKEVFRQLGELKRIYILHYIPFLGDNKAFPLPSAFWFLVRHCL